MNKRNVYIIAGPNGSGKTTFAEKFLPDYANCPSFVNADLIARGLSPFSPSLVAIKAGKLVLSQIHEFIKSGSDFAFETTLAGRLYVNLFNIYLPLADKWMLFANTGVKPLLIARKNNGGMQIIDAALLETVLRRARVNT